MTTFEQAAIEVVAVATPTPHGTTDNKTNEALSAPAPLLFLPTPSRRRIAPNVAASPQGVTATSGAPAPWDLPDSAAARSQHSGYRELLQFRGQHAIQRSRISGTGPPPPPAAAAKMDRIMEGNCLPVSTMWGTGNDTTMQQVQQAQNLNVQQMQIPYHFQPMCSPGFDAPGGQWNPCALTLPIVSRQDGSQLAFGALGQQAPSQWTPQSLTGSEPSPFALPSPGQQFAYSDNSCVGSPCSSPQDMMTTLMGSGAFALDDQHIADALQAAAPCEYED